MNVPQDVLVHKTLMIAMMDLAEEVATELGVDGRLPVAAMARALDANRTAVYPQRERLIEALVKLAQAGPGRPAAASEPSPAGRWHELALTLRVMEFRARHADAVVEHANRSAYSPSFRRFILGELDGWEGTLTDFASACRLPIDTVKDWVSDDRAGLRCAPPAKPAVEVPVDASETTRSIVRDFELWEGSTKDFLRVAGQRYGLAVGQVIRLLRIVGAIAGSAKRPFRHRGATERLSPGAMLVTDGKTIDVKLTGSGRRLHKNWQGMVDQATGCDTAAVVTNEEDAGAARRAFDESVAFLGGVAPEGLLHDNKPCYSDAEFRDHVAAAGTQCVPATLGRAQNKAIVEGEFSLFEVRVGTIRLDDSSRDALIHSAAAEVVRAYTAATNAVGRPELNGASRQAAVRAARPSVQQRAADRRFVSQLKERHDRQRHSDWRSKIKLASRQLLDHVFARLDLEDRDPSGKLREYLSTYEAAAIRQAASIVAVRLEGGRVEREHAHRYLAKVIQSVQASLDLERQQGELLALCRLQGQDWVSTERAELDQLQREHEGEALACALAERAAYGALPVESAFWTEQLLALLEHAGHLAAAVRAFLVRLYEAPVERRLSLLDRIAAQEWGLA